MKKKLVILLIQINFCFAISSDIYFNKSSTKRLSRENVYGTVDNTISRDGLIYTTKERSVPKNVRRLDWAN